MSKKKKSILDQLRVNYKLILLNDYTFEERFYLRITALRAVVLMVAGVLLLIASTIALIAFTPMREFVPGYASVMLEKNIVRAAFKTDSLLDVVRMNERYIKDFKNVITDNFPPDRAGRAKEIKERLADSFNLDQKPSKAEIALRKLIETEDKSLKKATYTSRKKTVIDD